MIEGQEIAVWSLLMAACATDILWGKIHNILTFPFLFAGLVYRFSWVGKQAGIDSLLAVLLAFALFFPLYRLKAFAAADVKLLMAVGAWTDPTGVVSIGLFAILIGAAVGAIVMLRQTGLRQSFGSLVAHISGGKKERSHRMPFAPAFLCAYAFLRISEIYRWNFF